MEAEGADVFPTDSGVKKEGTTVLCTYLLCRDVLMKGGWRRT